MAGWAALREVLDGADQPVRLTWSELDARLVHGSAGPSIAGSRWAEGESVGCGRSLRTRGIHRFG